MKISVEMWFTLLIKHFCSFFYFSSILMCSRPGWMGPWAVGCSIRYGGWWPCMWQRGWSLMILGVPSNPSHFMILWFFCCYYVTPVCFHGCRSNKRKLFLASVNKYLNSNPSSYSFIFVWIYKKETKKKVTSLLSQESLTPLTPGEQASSCYIESQNPESFELEGSLRGHLVQHPCNEQGLLQLYRVLDYR